MRLIDADALFDFLTDQLEEEVGFYSKGRNAGLNIARSALHDTTSTPTIVPLPNAPLTLEELRGMDGEPVWVDFPKCPEASGWMLISASRHCVYNGLLGDCDFENCGRNWLACRRRPEALGGEAAPTLSRP